jgi:hypothetical protein
MDPRQQLAEHLKFLAALGVDGLGNDPAWSRAATDGPVPRPAAPDPGTPVRLSTSAADALAAIRDDIGDCTRCKLHRLGRTQVVYGVGNARAELMFVGEAPGHDEDVQGIPFVGRAGQLLTKIIEAIGLRRDDVYIANVIKCRPPENRNPEPDEVATCQPFLFRQIKSISPGALRRRRCCRPRRRFPVFAAVSTTSRARSSSAPSIRRTFFEAPIAREIRGRT